MSSYCKVCKEEIRGGARICTTCGSFQDWRRFMNISSSFLALIIALISVVSLATPVLKEALRPNDASVKFYLIGPTQTGSILATAYNEGGEPSFFSTTASVVMTNKYGHAILNYYCEIEGAEREVMTIEPDDIIDLYFDMNELVVLDSSRRDSVQNMRFELMTVSYKAKPEVFSYDIKPQHMYYIWAYMNQKKLIDTSKFLMSSAITIPVSFFDD